MSQEAKQAPKKDTKMVRVPVDSQVGKFGITEEVLAVMAGIAAMDVEGVHSINRNATRQLIAKLGMKSLAGGVKLAVQDGVISVSLNINVDYGANVGEVSAKVQEKVKNSLENMTGLTVETVNVSVAGVSLPDKKAKS